MTDKKSFESIKNWMVEIEKFANENVAVFLVGNKCDLQDQRQISSAQGAELARQYNVPYFETSAKSGSQIEDAFLSITRSIYDQQQALASKDKDKDGDKRPFKAPETAVLTVHISDKKDSCCLAH